MAEASLSPREGSPGSWQERITEAQILLGGNAADRDQARSMLEEVAQQASGTHWATTAMNLLRSSDPLLSVVSPQEDVLRREWLSIHHLRDGRLAPFLRQLHEVTGSRVELVADVLDQLRRWLAEEARELDDALLADHFAEPEPRLLAVIDRVCACLSALPKWQVELAGELADLHRARFGSSLRSLSAGITSACTAWAIDDAWHLMRQLDGKPVSDEQYRQVQELEAAIYQADAARAEVEAMLERLSAAEVNDWSQLRILLELTGEARQAADQLEPPQPWRRQLERGGERLVEAARSFLGRLAAGCTSCEAARAFHAQYERLRLAGVDRRLEPQPEWFEPAVAALQGALCDRVVTAGDPGELQLICQNLESDLWSLPPLMRGQVQAWHGQITQLVQGWQGMESGEEFSEPAAMSLIVPAMVPIAFSEQIPRYQTLLDRISAAGRSLARVESQQHEKVVQHAMMIAREVQEEVPGHAGAERLLLGARVRQTHLELDHCLRQWQLDRFLELVAERAVEPPYRALAGVSSILRSLARLRSRPPLTTSDEAADWWQQWQVDSRQLPADLPAALRSALTEEVHRRRREWHAALERLLSQDLTPDSCRAISESLQGGLDELALRTFHKRLRHREHLGRARQLLDEQAWDAAAEALAHLPADEAQVRQLLTRLELGRAREAGVASLAAALNRSWTDAVAVMPADAYAGLVHGLEQAWLAGDLTAVRQLQEVARRAVREDETPDAVRAEVRAWLAWLRLEESLSGRLTAAAVRNLVAYLRQEADNPHLRQRLEALVGRWQEQERTVALAWARQAFAHLEPPLFPGASDPADRLIAAGEREAEAVMSELASKADVTLQELSGLRRRLDRHLAAWRDLDDYLSLLDREVQHHEPPRLLRQVVRCADSLQQVLANLQELERSDLRRSEVWPRWEATRVLVIQELGELPVAAGLLQRLERLNSLKGVRFDESRIREAAQRCGSLQPEHLDEELLFQDVADKLGTLAGHIESAGESGHYLWQLLSQEYRSDLPASAGDLRPAAPAADLPALAERFSALEREEQLFRRAMVELKAAQPWDAGTGGFDPHAHLSYLQLFPCQAPSSRRVQRLFERFVQGEPRRSMLQQSVALLPEWLGSCLKKGAV